MLQVMRRSMVLTFWAFLLFALAYIALGRITDPRAPFDAVAGRHWEIGASFAALAYGGEVVLLLVLAGGLPVMFTVVKGGLAGGSGGLLALFRLRRKWLLGLLGGALGCALLLIGTIVGSELLFGGMPASGGQPVGVPQTSWEYLLAGLALVGGTMLVVFLLLVVATALSAAVARSEFGPKLLRFVLGTISVAVLGMGITALATIAWLISFWVEAPRVALSPDVLGGVGLAWVGVVIVAMVVATGAAGLASWWGWRARIGA